MKFSHEIKAETGLHGRAAAQIVNKCYPYKSNISVVYNGKIGSVDSIMSLISLEAKQGNVINVIIEGEDEVEVYRELIPFFKESL